MLNGSLKLLLFKITMLIAINSNGKNEKIQIRVQVIDFYCKLYGQKITDTLHSRHFIE